MHVKRIQNWKRIVQQIFFQPLGDVFPFQLISRREDDIQHKTCTLFKKKLSFPPPQTRKQHPYNTLVDLRNRLLYIQSVCFAIDAKYENDFYLINEWDKPLCQIIIYNGYDRAITSQTHIILFCLVQFYFIQFYYIYFFQLYILFVYTNYCLFNILIHISDRKNVVFHVNPRQLFVGQLKVVVLNTHL